MLNLYSCSKDCGGAWAGLFFFFIRWSHYSSFWRLLTEYRLEQHFKQKCWKHMYRHQIYPSALKIRDSYLITRSFSSHLYNSNMEWRLQNTESLRGYMYPGTFYDWQIIKSLGVDAKNLVMSATCSHSCSMAFNSGKSRQWWSACKSTDSSWNHFHVTGTQWEEGSISLLKQTITTKKHTNHKGKCKKIFNC